MPFTLAAVLFFVILFYFTTIRTAIRVNMSTEFLYLLRFLRKTWPKILMSKIWYFFNNPDAFTVCVCVRVCVRACVRAFTCFCCFFFCIMLVLMPFLWANKDNCLFYLGKEARRSQKWAFSHTYIWYFDVHIFYFYIFFLYIPYKNACLQFAIRSDFASSICFKN